MVTGLILPPKTDEQNAGSGIRGLATISHLTRPKRPPDHSNRNTVDRVTLPGGSGFERSVPRKIATVRVFVRVRPIYRRTIIRAVAGLGEPIELSGGIRRAVTHRPEAASHQGRAVGGASASRNRRFESVPLQRGVCCELRVRGRCRSRCNPSGRRCGHTWCERDNFSRVCAAVMRRHHAEPDAARNLDTENKRVQPWRGTNSSNHLPPAASRANSPRSDPGEHG